MHSGPKFEVVGAAVIDAVVGEVAAVHMVGAVEGRHVHSSCRHVVAVVLEADHTVRALQQRVEEEVVVAAILLQRAEVAAADYQPQAEEEGQQVLLAAVANQTVEVEDFLARQLQLAVRQEEP